MAEQSNNELSSPPTSRKAGKWLAELMNRDGSLRNVSSIDAYYKAILGLSAAGFQEPSERMLNYVTGKYLLPNGDLDGSGCVWFEKHRTYPHSWLLMAAVVRARLDLVHRLADFLERFQDPESGGFFATTEQLHLRGRQEMMATGVAAIALAWAGRIEAALKTGHWFRRMYEAQPDLAKGLYFVWDRRTGLVTDYPAEQAVEFRVDASQLAQWYFQYGIAAALATCLYGATSDNSWLQLGRSYLDATKYCREDVLRQGTSGKIGWGAAWMFRVTGDQQDRAIAQSVYSNLRDTQHADGWWSVTNIYSRDWSTLPEPQVSVTGEFAVLTSWMENALLL